MKRIKTLLLLILLFVGFNSCKDENQFSENLIQDHNPLYTLYPDFKKDSIIQSNTRIKTLLEHLAGNTEGLDVVSSQQISIVPQSAMQSNPNERSFQNSLWQVLMNDSTVKIKEIIVPSSFFQEGSQNERNLGGNIDCDCISTATGLVMPDDVCPCDQENTSDPSEGDGGGSDTGDPDSYTGITYGSPSSTEEFLTNFLINNGGSSSGWTSGTNTNGTSNENILIIGTELNSIFTDPNYYSSIDRFLQLSVAEAMYWNGWMSRIDEVSNQDLYYDLQRTASDYSYLNQHDQDAYELFSNLLRSPATSGIFDAAQRAEIALARINFVNNLKGQYMMAIFLPVAEAAKPWIELALLDIGVGVLFQAAKGILSIKWGVELTKLGINTSSISTVVNRMKSGLSFGSNNSSLTLKIGGRNLVSSSVNGPKSTYTFNNVSSNQAKAIFDEIVNGRKITRETYSAGKYRETLIIDKKQSITYRNFSESNLGEVTIQFKLNDVRSLYGIELKFLP